MMRCEGGRVIGGWRLTVAPEVAETGPQREDERQDGRHAPLEPARRAHADQGPHEQAQVAGPRVDEQSFEDVGMPSQVRPSHAAGVVQMRVRPFEVLAPSPQQGHAPCPADASAIRIDRVAGHGLLRPVASAAIWFRDVAPQVEGRQIREHLITVVPLVRHDLVDHHRVVVGHRGHGFEVLRRGRERVGDRRRIALIGPLHGDAHNGPRLQIDRVFGLVREVRATVLHLRDARVRVVWMPPVCIAAFLRARPIQPRQVGARRRLDARSLRQPRQKLLIRLARVAAHNAPQRRIGLERRGINPNGRALDQIGGRQHLEDPREDGPMRLHVDQAPCPRNRRVLGWRFVEAQPQEAPEREGIGGAPRNPALRINAFEVADQQQAEVRARRQTRAADRRGVERLTLAFDERVEAVRVEHLIQSVIERMPARDG